MNYKSQILFRITCVFILMILMSLAIVVQVIRVQYQQGDLWKKIDDSLHVKSKKILAERGTIFSDDGNILSASLPFYDLYIDFEAPLMIDDNGKLFRQSVDSIAGCFARLFGDKSVEEYKYDLLLGYKKKINFYLVKKRVNYQDVQIIKSLPMIRQAKNNIILVLFLK